MRRSRLKKWSLLIIWMLPPAIFAQKDQTPKFSARVDLVPVDVEVLDQAGMPALGLGQQDFVVRENGRPMTITNFSRMRDRPVSLAILLDTSAIALEKLNVAKQFIFQIIHLLDRGDDICLYTLTKGDATLEVDFTRDRAAMIDALENISVPAQGSGGVFRELFGKVPPTGLGIDLALLRLGKMNNGKKALLVISNRFRGLGPATVEHVQDSGCTLLTLGFDNTAALFVTLGGDQISRAQLMRESGGRRFSAETEDITGVCRSIASSLKNYYSLEYQTEIRPGDERRRRIQVQIPGHRYVINARRSFIPAARPQPE